MKTLAKEPAFNQILVPDHNNDMRAENERACELLLPGRSPTECPLHCGISPQERVIMWKPNRNQWFAFGIGFLPVAVLFLSAMSAFMRNDRQALWPLTVFLGAVIALVTALTISWLEARR